MKYLFILLLVSNCLTAQKFSTEKVYALTMTGNLELPNLKSENISLSSLDQIVFDYLRSTNCYGKLKDGFIDLSIYEPHSTEVLLTRKLHEQIRNDSVYLYSKLYNDSTGEELENPKVDILLNLKDSYKFDSTYVFDRIKKYKSQLFQNDDTYKIVKVTKNHQTYKLTNCIRSYNLEFKNDGIFEHSFSDSFNCLDTLIMFGNMTQIDPESSYFSDRVKNFLSFTNGYFLSNESTLVLFSKDFKRLTKYTILYKNEKQLIIKSLNETIVELERNNF